MDDNAVYGTKYRGCHYRKVYEVFNENLEVDGHAFSARQAKRMIDDWKSKAAQTEK